jgi:hypothetical protein
MNQFPFDLLGQITKSDWIEVLKSLPTFVTATVAYCALRNWRRQERAKHVSSFLAELLQAALKIKHSMAKACSLVSFVQKSIIDALDEDAPSPEWRRSMQHLQRYAKSDAARLKEILKDAEPALLKLEELVFQGNIYNFDRYEVCRASIEGALRLVHVMELFLIMLDQDYETVDEEEAIRQIRFLQSPDVKTYETRFNSRLNEILDYASRQYRSTYG